MTRSFKDLSEREILALAISLEEEDSRIYADFADGLREIIRARLSYSVRCAPRSRNTGPD